jgi:hypothetical protein
MDVRDIGWGDMNWINLVQEGDKWRAFVKVPMNHLL